MTRRDVIQLLPEQPRGVFEASTQAGRTVLCEVRSVTRAESYAARAHDIHPEVVFVLAEYREYNNEPRCKWNDVEYDIIRTYVSGMQIELVAQRRRSE